MLIGDQLTGDHGDDFSEKNASFLVVLYLVASNSDALL